MKAIYVSSGDIDNWYANGEPDSDLMEVAVTRGPGVYLLENSVWTQQDYLAPDIRDIGVIEDMLDTLQTAVMIEPSEAAKYNALRNLLYTSLERVCPPGVTEGVWTKMQYELGGNPRVINYIGQFRFYEGKQGLQYLTHIFTRGFCYYFAVQLREAMGHGKVVECVGLYHIVWEDTDGKHYDINGLYNRVCNYSEDFDKSIYLHS